MARRVLAAGREGGRRNGASVAAVRGALLLGPTKAGRGAFVGALEFPESNHGCRASALHLCPLEVIALAVVASLGAQLFDTSRIGHQSPRLRASSLRSRAIWSGSVRLRNSARLSLSRISCR